MQNNPNQDETASGTRPADTGDMQPVDTEQGQPAQVRLAVRSLAETVYRRGGLGGPVYGGVSGSEGQRLHKRFSEKIENQWPDDPVLTEKTVRISYEPSAGSSGSRFSNLALQISGRVDALILRRPVPILIEVKSFSGSAELLPQGGELVHWAQAKLYAWLYLAEEKQTEEIQIGVSYIHQETETIVGWQQTLNRETLRQFFEKTCRSYIAFASDILSSQQTRRQSGLNCRFPYSGLRPGQKAFMRQVVGTARQKGTLLAQAPTGTGKTMAVLYPAVKALSNQLVDHAFYLTAMTSTRQIAVQAMRDLRQTGLQMKAIVFYAKEKLCLAPDIYCDNRQCPYATAYFDHLPAALHQLFLHETIDQEQLLDSARKHKVCPFELALDMSLYCEIIICDYNYAFDPRVRLERFFGQDASPQLLLIDEAHNLPDRSRAMFSAVFDQTKVLKARQILKDKAPPLETALERIDQYLTKLVQATVENKPGFSLVEKMPEAQQEMQADAFRAIRCLPERFMSLLVRFTFQAHSFLDEQPDWAIKKPLLDVYFQALFMIKIADGYFDDAYVTAFRTSPVAADLKSNLLTTRPGQHQVSELDKYLPSRPEISQTARPEVPAKPAETVGQLELMCLNAAEKLADAYRDKQSAIFFSATLSPLRYYSHLLHGYHPDLPPETLVIPSPFPAENLHVMICPELSTRYKQRQDTLASIRDMILAAVTFRTGNYLVYVPSFAYLRQIRQLLRAQRPDAPIDYMFQLPNLSEAKRRQYLERFNQFGKRTLMAFAVMGGQFSEGIDLMGDKLSGVIIVGVGLPKLSPEREIMKQYYDHAMGQGYAHAYLFPGFNKVQQAAGRVIRSENDRGFVLLIDDRYQEQVYKDLFPSEWQPETVANPEELTESLQVFWDS